MSLKPPKKSDLGKAWMQPRRDKGKRLQPEYHLIVTEGTNTEPAYFGAIKEVINSRYQGKIQLNIFGEGDNTLNLFEKAQKHALLSPFECLCRNFILPEICKPCLFLSIFQFAQLILPYPVAKYCFQSEQKISVLKKLVRTII